MILAHLTVSQRVLIAKWIDWENFRHIYPLPSYMSPLNVSTYALRLLFHKGDYKTLADIPFIWHAPWFMEFYDDLHEIGENISTTTVNERIVQYIIDRNLFPDEYIRYHRNRECECNDSRDESGNIPSTSRHEENTGDDQQSIHPASDASDTPSQILPNTMSSFLDRIHAYAPPSSAGNVTSSDSRPLTDEILDILQQIYDSKTDSIKL